MLERLKWDSDFFGYPVGKINLENVCAFPVPDAVTDYRLVYVFSGNKIEALDDRMTEVDIKTTLTKKINPAEVYPFSKSIEEYRGTDDASLKKLAFESGVYSRFKRDNQFKNGEFERLYTVWIEDSIARRNADHLLVFMEEGIVRGFLTLKFANNHSDIGLIAVDGNSRGKGIGLALLNAAFCQTKIRELPLISVVTQFENAPAMNMYLKAGFETIDMVHVYHIWNNP